MVVLLVVEVVRRVVGVVADDELFLVVEVLVVAVLVVAGLMCSRTSALIEREVEVEREVVVEVEVEEVAGAVPVFGLASW